MKEIILTPKEQPSESLEAEAINPSIFAGKSIDEIKNLEIFWGNGKAKLDDFFDVEGTKIEDAEDLRIVIKGSADKTKRIGEGMEKGEILIRGSVDMYLGARMKGGKIVVEGDTGSFAALEMRGGEVIVKGNCDDYLGSAYRGEWRGMRGGLITVEGNVGSEAGAYMMGGKIHVKGDIGSFAGVHMKKGLIVVDGNTIGRVGAQMIGGSIVVHGNAGTLLPGFKMESREKNIEINGNQFKGDYLKFSGDHAESISKGLLYIRKDGNKDLKR